MSAAPALKWRPPAIGATANADEGFRETLGACAEQIRANRAAFLEGRDPESLHQLRVGARRLRASLRAFRRLLKRRPAAAFDARLEALLDPLGEARDWDVFVGAFAGSPLADAARGPARGAQARARAALRSGAFAEALAEAEAWHARPAWRSKADPRQPLAGFAGAALRRLHREARRAGRALDWADEAGRHRLRIRVKRLRYAAEGFLPALPAHGAKDFLRRLRGLQGLLGELNDLRVQRSLLDQLPEGAKVRAAARSARARLARRERVLIRAAKRAWTAYGEAADYARRPATGRGRG